jgi:hypothetical protein
MEMLRRDGLAFRYETKFSIHSTDDLDRVLQDHAFVLDKDRPVEARGLTHAELFDTNKEQQEIRKQHVEELLRTGRVLRCSAASHISEASAEGRKDSAKRANDQDMIYYWVPSEYQVDLSDKSFEHRLGEVRKLWRQITDPTPAGASARPRHLSTRAVTDVVWQACATKLGPAATIHSRLKCRNASRLSQCPKCSIHCRYVCLFFLRQHFPPFPPQLPPASFSFFLPYSPKQSKASASARDSRFMLARANSLQWRKLVPVHSHVKRREMSAN